jgi:UDP-N-acetylmuramate: L-alanyl-gamma-D-glutamyl-meso-diaminopimelate ligase
MSDQLRALGIELIEGFDADAARARSPTCCVIGNVVTRGKHPLMEAILDAGAALHQRPAVAGRARAAGPPRAGGGRHARQDRHHLACWRGSWRARGC